MGDNRMVIYIVIIYIFFFLEKGVDWAPSV